MYPFKSHTHITGGNIESTHHLMIDGDGLFDQVAIDLGNTQNHPSESSKGGSRKGSHASFHLPTCLPISHHSASSLTASVQTRLRVEVIDMLPTVCQIKLDKMLVRLKIY